MTMFQITHTAPTHNSTKEYSGLTPPTIAVAGNTLLAQQDNTFKWFSSVPRVKTGSVNEYNAYWNSHINFELGGTNNGSTYVDAKSFDWTTARIGTQSLVFVMKDVFINNGDDIETFMKLVEDNGVDGGKNDVAASVTINKLLIHVLGSIFILIDTNDNVIRNDTGTLVVETTSFFIGGECRPEGTWLDYESNPPTSNVTYNWGTDNDDEIEYLIEYHVNGTTWTPIYDSTTDAAKYRIGAETADTNYNVSAIGVDHTPTDPYYDYRITVSRGLDSQQKTITVSIVPP